MTRTLSPLTIALVAAMASDPQSPASLREFHRERLADMGRRAKRQRTPRPSAFSRFAESLETETITDP